MEDPTSEEMRGIQPAWDLYFTEEEDGPCAPGNDFIRIALQFIRFFRGPAGREMLRDVDLQRETVVRLNYEDFIHNCDLVDLEDSIREESELVLRCLRLAISSLQVLDQPHRQTAHAVAVRLQNVTPLTPLRDVKASAINCFVAVRGNVVRVSAVRPLVVTLTFQCVKCQTEIRRTLPDGKFEPPTQCTKGNCRNKRFEALWRSATTRDWQKIKLQEMEDEHAEPGRIPRTVEVELTDDLVDTCVPGDVVTVAGTIKGINTDVAAGRHKSRAKSLFALYLDAHSVTAHRVAQGGSLDTKQFSEKELRAVCAIAEHPDPFALVVASLCPSIFGQEAVKAGLALGLFGGSQPQGGLSESVSVEPSGDAPRGRGDEGDALAARAVGGSMGTPDRWRMGPRCDPHVLVVGDPGLGKSQMLRAVSSLAPRGVYVSGNTTSATGLTVTMVRDQLTGDYGLEAGALVLSDQGICCIDEFDKMAREHRALLEAMEQQRISVAKAGIVSSLSARTTVLAAANPVGGHYDKARTIAENLKIAPPLLSRFDLVFIMLDKPDEARDKELSKHVISMHAGGQRRRNAGNAAHDDAADKGMGLSGTADWMQRRRQARLAAAEERLASQAREATQQAVDTALGRRAGHSSDSAARKEWESDESLDTRLRMAVLNIQHPLPPQLLRKYVAYARRFCHPALSPAAASVLQSFYLQLRLEHSTEESTPITTRQLESLIRLSQARAKIELREVVTKQDAIDVVDLMKSSLFDAAMDEVGVLDFSRSGGMSSAKQVRVLVSALNKAATKKRSSFFRRDEIVELIQSLRLNPDSVDSLLQLLNDHCYLLIRPNKTYRLMCSNFDAGGQFSQRFGGRNDVQELDVKGEGGSSLDLVARAARAVAQVGRDGQSTALPDAHVLEPALPSLDHLAAPQRELERIIAVPRTVKLLASRIKCSLREETLGKNCRQCGASDQRKEDDWLPEQIRTV